jgi:mycoredoxin
LGILPVTTDVVGVSLAEYDPIPSEEIPVLTMYSTSWCGYCHRLKSQLEREGISYEIVDIEADHSAAEFVASVNGGNQTVPTVRFDDGSTLTNPSIIDVKDHLARIGTASSCC